VGEFRIITNENGFQYQESIMSEHPWLLQLNEQGYRLTDSRREVVEIMAQSSHALTPIEVYDEARTNHPALGLVTVYRTLEALEGQGLIQRVHQPEGCQAFITAPAGHQHLLLCKQCGQAALFEGDDLETLIVDRPKTGYQITEHWLQLLVCAPIAKGLHDSSTLLVLFVILTASCGGQPVSDSGTTAPVF
jgi:Fe2+ or Zn2+ uptake regulation protein